MTTPRFVELQRRLQPLRDQLVSHPVYSSLRGLEDLHGFLSLHVFAVWDFMSLLKALQRRLTCVDEVWRPVGDPASRRLINEIVLGEESDQIAGAFTSHFEMYTAAVRQCGGSTAHIDAVLRRVDAGEDVLRALASAPAPARRFSTVTFEAVRSGSLAATAASFTLGREDVIPSMFRELVHDLRAQGRADTSLLIDYLDRHVEVDGEEHGPMAAQLLSNVCGDDEGRWAEAEQAAVAALRARLGLWDGVVERTRTGAALGAGAAAD
ncbi:MAG: DUF3050 domain-containing protein [Planctomycetota bacterium]